MNENKQNNKLYEDLRNKCLYLIASSPKTEKKLRDKIQQSKKTYPEEIIEAVIENLKQYNYINDVDYAERFIELNKNKYSIKVLKEKLYIKGINTEIIEELFSENDEENEINTIKKLLYKKYPNYDEIKNNLEYKEKGKIFAYLVRKGFNYDLIQKVMNEY